MESLSSSLTLLVPFDPSLTEPILPFSAPSLPIESTSLPLLSPPLSTFHRYSSLPPSHRLYNASFSSFPRLRQRQKLQAALSIAFQHPSKIQYHHAFNPLSYDFRHRRLRIHLRLPNNKLIYNKQGKCRNTGRSA